jgi:hypothetical protein
MGQIVRAVDRRHGRPVAIKRPLSADGAALERFVREARMAARLSHPGIVPVYEAGILPSGEPFFAMKQVEGRNLGDIVRATRSFQERLALLPNLIAVADALAYAHDRGVVHRDVTPTNVLVGAHGETLIIDWGVAKELGASGVGMVPMPSPALAERELTATRGVVGTPRYMSPEQARGAVADLRSDVYSLGAVLHFELSGRPPYAGVHAAAPRDVLSGAPPPLARLAPEVPRDLASIVARAMARAPEARYANAGEVADDLKRFVAGGLVSARAYSLGALLRRWARRRRAALTAATASVVAIAVIAALSYADTARERDAVLAAQRRSEAFSAGGERLVAFLIDRLHEKLLAIGRLDALAGLGPEIERYYEAVAASTPTDAMSSDHSVRALTVFADVERDRGNLEQARRLVRAALAMLDERARRFGADADVLRDRAGLLARLGQDIP